MAKNEKDGNDKIVSITDLLTNVTLLNLVEKVGELEKKGINAAHYDMRFVKPLDEVILHEVFSKFKAVVTVEDGSVQGGFGSAVLEWMVDQGYSVSVKRLGVPDKWIEHGTQAELYNECGYDAAGIEEPAVELIAKAKDKEINLGAYGGAH